MSLQFVFGNSGAGKSHYLYQTVIEESMNRPDMNYLVLVPEQFTMQTQKDLCMMHPRHGIMNIDVLSFGRLAHRVFEEIGGDTKQILDDEGKNLILRKIAGAYGEELRVLRGNLKKQGYISEVKSVISEFTQYGIGPEELDEFMEELIPDSYLYYKLQDIGKVYDGFENYLADKYITKEELLDVLSDVAKKSSLLQKSVVVLDGFTGFTPVQNKLLGELMETCEKVIVTVVMDGREDPYVYRHPYQLFALSKQMVTELVKIAGEHRTVIDDDVRLYNRPVYRFKDNEALGFLESDLFRYSKKQYEKEQEVLTVHAAANPKREAEYVASQIRRMVREKGYRYRDIAVIAGDLKTYAVHMEKACEAYGIPVFMDHKKSILLNAFVEYLRSLLAMAEQNFSYESVFRFLRTGMTGFDRREVDMMENYVLALGLRGYKKWQSAWVRRTSGMDEETLAALNGLRIRFVEQIDSLVMVLKQKYKTVGDVTAAVYEFLVRRKMQTRLKEMENHFQEQGELALAKEYAQVYRITIELFDKFVELLGDERISLKEYCELLDAGLEEAKVGVIPPSLDQVVVGDVERTRLKDIKALFFLGANDTLLPGSLTSGGLLTERDRDYFAKQKISLSPGAKEKTYIQKFYLYMNLTKPTDYLSLSFSKVSMEGKTLRPAYLIQDIRRLYPLLHIQDEETRDLCERELTEKTAADYLVQGLRDRRLGLSQEWKELYNWYAKKKDVGPILDAAFFRKEPDRIQKEAATQMYGDPSRFSVTRLERFASCAYAHFLTYGLRLSDRKQYEFEAMDLGNIAHRSMEIFSRRAQTEKVSWTEMEETQRARWVEESVEKSIADYGNTILYSTARNEYMITRIKKLIHRSVWALTKQLKKGDFIPSGYEMKFGSGKIDRIDTCADENKIYVKVTDYKTGAKSFDITAFYYGLQMQLPVYLNAAMGIEQEKHPGQEVVPAGIFYYRMKDPIVEKENNETLLEEKILKELKLDGLVNSDDAVIGHLEHDLRGKSNLIPVGRNKDGSLSRNSRTLEPEEFEVLLAYTKRKEKELKTRILSGETAAYPYELGKETGCDYCAYQDICGFDSRLWGYKYQPMEKLGNEEVLEKMKQTGEEQKNGYELD
ncbi:PD-(D/E)XK nuclease family protein [Clostridium sp. C105KSO13]|uniref:PD-(D/E)XK nuclease family protein n=1 Tax=Clostridium sp. C105KSO13 TaxID=1776045 RepID=UPI0007407C5F|nr:PD-(D/E)XK nuclease family protein [Clostridium sp. C105KSO13]CUX45505.1 ATP-dependent helicase/deoxyribonuclease subunit B [Clostridium sp. C105KSO13]